MLWDGRNGTGTSMAFSPDGQRLVTAGVGFKQSTCGTYKLASNAINSRDTMTFGALPIAPTVGESSLAAEMEH